MDEKKKTGLARWMRKKYRLSVLDDMTLTEYLHIRLSGWSALVTVAVLFLLTLLLFSLVILYTPIRHYLPGYSEDIRQQLVEENARVDSLGMSMELQRQYLNVVKQVVAGEVHSDTVQSLDSMQIIMREELLEAKSAATQEFIAQYEAKERDMLQFFDVTNNTPMASFFRPANGVIVQSFSDKEKQYGIALQTPENENVTAILAGTVVYINYEIDNSYSMVVQHSSYISVYRALSKVMRSVGDNVQAGESLALTGKKPLWFELWQNGQALNPEKVIAF